MRITSFWNNLHRVHPNLTECKKGLNIPKGLSESVSRKGTSNTMAKTTKIKWKKQQQSTKKQKTKARLRTLLKIYGGLMCSESVSSSCSTSDHQADHVYYSFAIAPFGFLIKWKTKNTTLSEQFQNPREKLQNEDKSIPMTHIHMTSDFWFLTGTSIECGRAHH
jgi:hypothetical protein